MELVWSRGRFAHRTGRLAHSRPPLHLAVLEERAQPAGLTVQILGAPLVTPEGVVNELDASVAKPNGPTPTDLTYSWLSARAASGSVLRFDGVDDFVRADRNVQDDFTLEAWIRTSASLDGASVDDGRGLIYADFEGTADDFGTSVLNGKFAFGVGSPDTTIQSVATVATGDWVHVAAVRTRSSGRLEVYVNGVLEAAGTAGTQALAASPDLAIGGNVGGGRHFQGEIDEIRVWSTARTGNQIRDLMFGRAEGTEAGLASYWRFDERAGLVAVDGTADGNDGVLGGGAATSAPTWTDQIAELQTGAGRSRGGQHLPARPPRPGRVSDDALGRLPVDRAGRRDRGDDVRVQRRPDGTAGGRCPAPRRRHRRRPLRRRLRLGRRRRSRLPLQLRLRR